jgi:septal ring factor EnvC (AmiA/AmiB activator)
MNNITLWLIRKEIQALQQTRSGIENLEASVKTMWQKLNADTKSIEKDLRDLADNVKAIRE